MLRTKILHSLIVGAEVNFPGGSGNRWQNHFGGRVRENVKKATDEVFPFVLRSSIRWSESIDTSHMIHYIAPVRFCRYLFTMNSAELGVSQIQRARNQILEAGQGNAGLGSLETQTKKWTPHLLLPETSTIGAPRLFPRTVEPGRLGFFLLLSLWRRFPLENRVPRESAIYIIQSVPPNPYNALSMFNVLGCVYSLYLG